MRAWRRVTAPEESPSYSLTPGAEPQRNYLVVLDEMWRAMRLDGAGLVDKADSITRLNGAEGGGNLFLTHSLRDMQSMSSEADNLKGPRVRRTVRDRGHRRPGQGGPARPV